MNENGLLFIALTRRYLNAYVDKLERSLAGVDNAEVWRRPNEASNSIGNLLLHLAGSTRFWIVGVVGETDTGRTRQEEFDAVTGGSASELLRHLRSAVDDADAILARVTADELLATRLAGDEAVTVLEAAYHAVEHFSMHTGQVIQLVKLQSAVDLHLTD